VRLETAYYSLFLCDRYEDGLIVVHKKTIVELSIVRDPFHKSCKIGFVGNTIPLKFMNKCRIKTKTDTNDPI